MQTKSIRSFCSIAMHCTFMGLNIYSIVFNAELYQKFKISGVPAFLVYISWDLVSCFARLSDNLVTLFIKTDSKRMSLFIWLKTFKQEDLFRISLYIKLASIHHFHTRTRNKTGSVHIILLAVNEFDFCIRYNIYLPQFAHGPPQSTPSSP